MVSESDLGIFWLLAKNFAWSWKLHFTCRQDYFEENHASIETLMPDFFGLRAENFSKFREIFCGVLSKCNLCFQRSFGGLNEVWENFWQFCQKFLAWVSINLSTCPVEAFDEKNASKNFYSLSFFEQGAFQKLGDFFIGRVAKHATYVPGDVFSLNVLFENILCLYNCFQSLSGRFLDFCTFFGSFVKIAFRVCIGIIRGKSFFQNTKNFVFGFWATLKRFWKAIRQVGENCLLCVQRNFWSYFFLNM